MSRKIRAFLLKTYAVSTISGRFKTVPNFWQLYRKKWEMKATHDWVIPEVVRIRPQECKVAVELGLPSNLVVCQKKVTVSLRRLKGGTPLTFGYFNRSLISIITPFYICTRAGYDKLSPTTYLRSALRLPVFFSWPFVWGALSFWAGAGWGKTNRLIQVTNNNQFIEIYVDLAEHSWSNNWGDKKEN